MTTEVRQIPIDQLHESSKNPRRHYDQHALEQLAENLRTVGQITPVVVRPHPNGVGGYELAAGHRRLRAATLAGLTELTAVVRDLDEASFVEVLSIENLQRDDLHPLEEAQGFVTLIKDAGYDVARIAERVGRSVKYVYDRLKLLQLIPEAQKLFLAGEFEAGHAIILARLSKEDQKRALGDPDGQIRDVGGVFQRETILAAQPGESELELDDRRKPVSVRELQGWVDRNVRFNPATVAQEDLAFDFPATAAALSEAAEAKEKVVKITREYRVPDEARDEKERTFGSPSWKRADGQVDPYADSYDTFAPKGKPSKTCDRSVWGLVVAGSGRGEAFRVCVDKKGCTVHWAQEQKEAARRSAGTSRSATTAKEREDRWQEERRRREAEEARWRKAIPALKAALAEKVAALECKPRSALVGSLIMPKELAQGAVALGLEVVKTAEDVLRVLAYNEIAESLDPWRVAHHAQKALGQVGLDAKKIRDQAVPVEKATTAAQTSATPKAKKALAGDVRRAAAKMRSKGAKKE